MAEQALALREYPQIVELLAVLEQSGLTKERDEVSSLVEYIDSMEEKLGQIDQKNRAIDELKDRIAALKHAKECPACGASCGRDDKFCKRCGRPF